MLGIGGQSGSRCGGGLLLAPRPFVASGWPVSGQWVASEGGGSPKGARPLLWPVGGEATSLRVWPEVASRRRPAAPFGQRVAPGGVWPVAKGSPPQWGAYRAVGGQSGVWPPLAM